MTDDKHVETTKKPWASLTPEGLAELRRLDGQVLTTRTTELVEDVDGQPLGFELGEPEPGVFYLPGYLLEAGADDDDEGADDA